MASDSARPSNDTTMATGLADSSLALGISVMMPAPARGRSTVRLIATFSNTLGNPLWRRRQLGDREQHGEHEHAHEHRTGVELHVAALRELQQPTRPVGRQAHAVDDAVDALPVSYTHLRAHETDSYLVCRLLL